MSERCGRCQSPLAGVETIACPDCGTRYHGLCASKAERCAAAGCARTGTLEPATPAPRSWRPYRVAALLAALVVTVYAAASLPGPQGKTTIQRARRALRPPVKQETVGSLLRREAGDLLRLSELIEALGPSGSASRSERGEVLVALQRLGPYAAPAVPSLIGVLTQRTGDGLRSEAAAALAAIGPDAVGAVPALTGVLEDPGVDAELREGAARALGRVGRQARSAVPALRRALGGLPPTQAAAVEALGRIGPAAAPAAPDLARLLDEPELQRKAIEALGRIGPDASAVLPRLFELSREGTERERLAAIAAIPKLLGAGAWRKQGVDALLVSLGSPDAQVRIAAAQGLGAKTTADARAVPGLVKALQDPARNVARAAARALGAIGPAAGAAAVPLFAVGKTLPHESLRALQKIGPAAAAAVPLLATVLPTDGHRRSALVSALVAIGQSGQTRDQVAAVLLKVPAAVRVSGATHLVLASRHREQLLPVWRPQLNTKRGNVRRQAVEVLKRIGTPAVVPDLLRVAQSDREATTRYYALNAVAAIGRLPEQCVPVLIKLLEDRDARVVNAAANGLRTFAPWARAAIPALERASRRSRRHYAARSARTEISQYRPR